MRRANRTKSTKNLIDHGMKSLTLLAFCLVALFASTNSIATESCDDKLKFSFGNVSFQSPPSGGPRARLSRSRWSICDNTANPPPEGELDNVSPSVILPGGTVTFHHNDHLGSPIAASDPYGNTLWRESYYPYGEKIVYQDDANSVGYTGHQFDMDTGLTYMQARYYDPVIGRFYGVDPVTVYDTGDYRYFNRYAYALNNPYKYTDPDGRCPTCISGGIGAGVGLLVGLGMEGYRQFKSGEFNGRTLLVEGGKGAVVGGLIGLTGGAAAAGGMGLGTQAVTTGAVGVGVGAGAHSVGEVAKGNPAPSASESLAVGAATGAGAVVGTAIGPVTSKLTTTVTPAISSHPVTSLTGRIFNTVNIPARTIERPGTAAVFNNTAGSVVEDQAKRRIEENE